MAPSAALRPGKIGANFNIWPSGISPVVLSRKPRRCHTTRSSLRADYRDLQWVSGTTWKEVCSRPESGSRYINVIADVSRIPESQTVLPPMRRGDDVTSTTLLHAKRNACVITTGATREKYTAFLRPGLNADYLWFLYDVLFTRETLPVIPQGFIRIRRS